MACPEVRGLRHAWEATLGRGAEEDGGAQRAERRRRLLCRLLGLPGSSAAFEAAVRFVGGAMERRAAVLKQPLPEGASG
jgi:hypothetical protein